MENRFTPQEVVMPSILAREYESESFAEASGELTREFSQATPEQRRHILMGRFIDCAPALLHSDRYKNSGETEFFNLFGMRPMDIDLYRMQDRDQLVIKPYRAMLLDGKDTPIIDSRAILYGPTTAYYVAPNELIRVELGDQDIISTAQLSSCTVLILQEGSVVTMAHITTPQEISEASKRLLSQVKSNEACLSLIMPEFFPIHDNEKSISRADNFNANRTATIRSVSRVAADAHVPLTVGCYPFISLDAARDRHISETAVVAGKTFCSTIGYTWDIDNDRKSIQYHFPIDTEKKVG